MRRLMAGCAAGLFVVAVATTASGQNLNVDLGDNFGSPPSTYAAAGTAGTWNTVNIESVALVDTAGFATTVSLTASADFTGGGPGMSPDVALLGDHIGDCNGVVEWSLAFTGLEHGNYRVLLYAPSNTIFDTGDMLVNAIAVPAILGASELQGGGLPYGGGRERERRNPGHLGLEQRCGPVCRVGRRAGRGPAPKAGSRTHGGGTRSAANSARPAEWPLDPTESFRDLAGAVDRDIGIDRTGVL